MPAQDLIRERYHYSNTRLNELKVRLAQITVLPSFSGLTIYAAGSYARFEASEYSDIDLFFIHNGARSDLAKTKMDQHRLFSQLITIADALEFPKFTDDGKYLEILYLDELLTFLGGRQDDFMNYFTARMLLLLESHPLLNKSTYGDVIMKIIMSYFRDYDYYPETFQPTFLINDIIRFWKTLCLNYEYERNRLSSHGLDDLEQTVRDFKLGFSRMLTCFATVAQLSRHDSIKPKDVLDLVSKTPRERMESLKDQVSGSSEIIDQIVSAYMWFLEKTGLPSSELHAFLKKEENEKEAFEKVQEIGTLMYALLKRCTEKNDYIRYLLI